MVAIFDFPTSLTTSLSHSFFFNFSWSSILIALAAIFIIFKLITFQIEMLFKAVIALVIAAAAVYLIYYK